MRHSAVKTRGPLRVMMIVALALTFLAFLLNLSGVSTPGSPPTPQATAADDQRPTADASPEVRESPGGVASSNLEVSRIGTAILADGGNAVDAAVAMAYAMGVVEPYSSGPGGGGGATISLAGEEDAVFVDFREISDADGTVRRDRFGIPGFFYGMEHLPQTYGRLPVEQVAAPAIGLAEDGVLVSPDLHSLLELLQNRIDTRASVFFDGGAALEAGTVVRQEAAAETLRGVVEHGAVHYYTDVLAPAVPDMRFDLPVLRDRLVVERRPLHAEVEGRSIFTAPAPFSGSTLIQYLTMADRSELPPIWQATPSQLTSYAQIADATYSSRALHVADPAFGGADAPIDGPDPGTDATAAPLWVEEPVTTTHISAIDREGMAVSMTLSLGNFFGNGKTIGGFFGNEVLAFSKTGVNASGPYKKVRSFMTPTIIRDGASLMAIGSPGGNKIPQIVGQVLLNYWESGSIGEATDLPRIVMQGQRASVELYRDGETEALLRRNGIAVVYDAHDTTYGAVNSVIRSDDGTLTGYADQRRQGSYEIVSVEDAS